ncbi:MAG: HAD family hydrolase [Deltaproteobacteria bacterium]|nr:MAG: HAD family hydrolase [Deltaproteobacteria bacterium]
MLNAVLLDLDNTLVLYDELKFFERYFEKLCHFFSDIFPPDEFTERVIKATMALGQNNGEMSNSRFFINFFAKGLKESQLNLWRRFIAFYENEYHKIDVDVTVPSGLHEVMRWMQHVRLKLVLASNPIYPPIALEKRLAWAGLDSSCFDLITHIENMSYVKPRPAYYRQICEKINESPAVCLMIGNDPVNDMMAARAGLKTYLTTDAGKIDYSSLMKDSDSPTHPLEISTPDYRGSFAEVILVIQKYRQ